MLRGTRFSSIRPHRRRGPILGLVVIACVMASVTATAATAQTFALDATVRGPTPGQGQKPKDCPDAAFMCGETTVAGFGSGNYGFRFASRPSVIPQGCGEYDAVDYTALITFTLEDGSVLALDEIGRVCAPGGSFSPSTPSFGNPVDGVGTWQVRYGTGLFEGMSGSGSDSFHSAGAHLKAAYAGDLTN